MDRRLFLGGLGALALPAPAFALPDLDAPRRHLIMRHALAPGFSDPDAFSLDDPTTQRNLSEAGRVQARRTGDALRAEGVSVDRVLSSQWRRCLDTADLLAMGDVEAAAPLNSFFREPARRHSQMAELKRMLLRLGPDVATMLVTHQVVISMLLGVYPKSGEVFAFEIGKDGETAVLDSLLIPA